MRQIYTPYVLLLVNILSIAGSHLEFWTDRRGRYITVVGVRVDFLICIVFPAWDYSLLWKKPTKKPEQNQNKQKSKEINKQKKQNKNQTAVIKFWNKNEGYIEMLVNCCC